jgi:ribosome-binding protein aMBF1 (putative translation factor)
VTAQTILLEGKPYVVLPRDEYDRLTTLAKARELPPLPEPDAQGNYPAVEYARASLARKIIRDRVAVGLSQRDLAQRAGVRVETLCRIETGKHTPSVPTIDKLDRALKHAANEPQAGKRLKRARGKGA